jgi:hypothetical protein
LIIERSDQPSGPGFGKINSINGSKHVDPQRGNTDLKNNAWISKVFFGQIV